MTASELQYILTRLGVKKYNGTSVAACKLCQPEETEPERFKLYVNPGKSLPVVLFCMRCSIPKAYTTEDKAHNKSVVHRNVTESGINADTFYTHQSVSEIEQIWKSIGPLPQQQEHERANDCILNHCYMNLLGQLDLNTQHRKWLDRKGLNTDKCEYILYRSTPTQQQSREASWSLHRAYGDAICTNVPGLTTERWLTRENAILIPCRDESGRIGALKQRLMGDGNGRMRLLSGNGPKAKQMIHWPLGSKVTKGESLWITEGERKADIVFFRLNVSTVGVPGTGTIGQCIEPAIRAETVVLAFDRDDAGRKATVAIGRSLLASGVKVQLAKWDARFKKVDDAIANGAQIDCVGVDSFGVVAEERKGVWQNREKGLDKDSILAYIRGKGAVLRDSLGCHPTLISTLIREGSLVMTKTAEGQLLEAV